MSEHLRGLHLHFDCVSGIAGDMTLAALLDLGVPVEFIDDALDAIGAGRERLQVRRVVKHGIAAVDVQVATEKPLAWPNAFVLATSTTRLAPPTAHTQSHGHGHTHAHEHSHSHGGEHSHHHYSEIRARLTAAPLRADVRARALDMFDRVARAEAKLHGMSTEDVTFHEVGAVDSVVDIVGTAAALAWLSPASVSCAAVAMGHGEFRCAHGVLPIPAPAALEIMREAGGIMTGGGVARELCTPTGAAILAAAVTTWTPPPTGAAIAVGWGAGDIDLDDRANVVRVTAIRTGAEPGNDALFRIEANVDDLNPELCAHAADAVFAAGAIDTWWTPIVMKKGRPALLFSALAPRQCRDAVVAAILAETTTIGVRFDVVDRVVLARELVAVSTEFGEVRVKLARDAAGRVMNVAPEHDDCRRIATATGVPLKQIYAAAIVAASNAPFGTSQGA